MSSIEKENDEFAEDLKNNFEVIKQIKNIQDLPEEIIFKFIKAAGSLSSTKFEKSFKYEQ